MTPKPKTKAPRCAVCRHPKRHEIEMLRVAGLSLDALSTKFGVHRDAIWRHHTNHVTDEAKAAYVLDVPIAELATRAAAEQTSLLEYFSMIRSSLMTAMLQAASVNNHHAHASLSAQATNVLKEIGRLTGEVSRITSITQNNTVVFANSPMFLTLKEMLIGRLLAWPEALQSVLEGLMHLDSPEAGNAAHEPLMLIAGHSDV